MGLKWYPHPEILHCIRGCERPKKTNEDYEDVAELYTKPFQGDNYCDAMNNRAYCNYDGGDCCHSTVKTKKVILFPSSCDVHSECACRDPNAPENRKGESVYSLG
ncbi:hypothetical protein MHYP_G00283570 [Metynnis hypsauchen]